MLSLENIVRNPEKTRSALMRRGEDPPIDQILELDQQRKRLIQAADTDRALRNAVSKTIGREKRKPTAKEIAEMRETGDRIKSHENDLESVLTEMNAVLLSLPNIPLQGVPDGMDEESNIIARTSAGDTPSHGNAHWDVGPRLGILDLEAGASIAGARFFVLKGKGAKLQRALAGWMLDVQTQEHGYLEIDPPLLVRPETMTGSGNLPKFKDNLYRDDETDLWLIPTAEVALNGLHQGQILEPGLLPLKYVAQTPSFRKEHASAGRDVRGIKRVHQFEKVEMFRYVEPENSEVALEEMVTEAEELCKRLDLTYRVLELCAGDIGFQSAKTYDIEVWSPGSAEWLEVSSISTCMDFQARRNGTRYRREAGDPTRFPHTLNGSGLALPRIWIAIIENGLQADGSVVIPDELVPYTGWDQIESGSK
ncbi:MAG: serine--tRNA ligase [Chloroflexota bacterium]|nr:serine--tRNA ligase [Chloroflexota bacterium]MQG37342.1 serine--tRNA ligase [SAR202 cluster bacterium]|tara:strand:+ start:14509 stop:15777 length:1269 start_codon:yes stop_codon:yes gene_type:complete